MFVSSSSPPSSPEPERSESFEESSSPTRLRRSESCERLTPFTRSKKHNFYNDPEQMRKFCQILNNKRQSPQKRRVFQPNRILTTPHKRVNRNLGPEFSRVKSKKDGESSENGQKLTKTPEPNQADKTSSTEGKKTDDNRNRVRSIIAIAFFVFALIASVWSAVYCGHSGMLWYQSLIVGSVVVGSFGVGLTVGSNISKLRNEL